MSKAVKEAGRLIKSGYCPVSNSGRILSRLDRPDWLEHMGFKHTEGFPGDKEKNLEEGMRWARGLGKGASDHYRRVHSKDTITVSAEVYALVKQSRGSHGWGGVDEYMELVG